MFIFIPIQLYNLKNKLKIFLNIIFYILGGEKETYKDEST